MFGSVHCVVYRFTCLSQRSNHSYGGVIVCQLRGNITHLLTLPFEYLQHRRSGSLAHLHSYMYDSPRHDASDSNVMRHLAKGQSQHHLDGLPMRQATISGACGSLLNMRSHASNLLLGTALLQWSLLLRTHSIARLVGRTSSLIARASARTTTLGVLMASAARPCLRVFC